jgi:hypothetical protein
MDSNGSEQDGRREAPRSGAPAPASLLDKGDTNVPNNWRPTWNRSQWKIRRAVLDRLRYWQVHEYECLWVTLTSAPTSSSELLRTHFQVLRKRIIRELDFPHVEYVCVDTREGHGVLHMIWACKLPYGHWQIRFRVDFRWLQEAWKEIHGAFHVNIKRIGGDDQDARRLSRYIVAQYCGGQNALVRLSQSKTDFPLSRARAALLSRIKGLPERYEFLNVLANSLHGEDFTRAANQFLRIHFRQAWDDLVRSRCCEAYGVQFVWCDGVLMQV